MEESWQVWLSLYAQHKSECNISTMVYCNNPRCQDGQVRANSVDPDQTAGVYLDQSLYCSPFHLHLLDITEQPHDKTNIKALQALHDTPALCLFLLLHMFWHKKYQCDQIHQLFHKIFSINIILKWIKGHNSVEKLGKIMCISHNMHHIYQCINKILSKSIHYF